MPFSTNDRALEAVANVLPADAFKVWCDTATNAEDNGLERNDCVKAAWEEINKRWEKPSNPKWKRWVEKKGARNNRADSKTIQEMHDHAVGLGAKCHADNDMAKGEDDFVEGEDVVKFASTNEVPVQVTHGLVMGFAIVSKKDGADYFDLQGDHIPEESMIAASVDFMQHSRVAKEMHAGEQQGSVVFAMPITKDIRDYIINNDTTGLFIGMKPSADMLAKFQSGEYTGFSIGGHRLEDEEA